MSKQKSKKKSALVDDFDVESSNHDEGELDGGTGKSSSIGFMGEEEKQNQTLENANKSNFLFKTGLLFLIYFLTWVISLICRRSLKMTSNQFIKIWFFIVIFAFIISLTIKISFGFFGTKLRKGALPFFGIDCSMIFIFILGISQFYMRLLEKDIYYLDSFKIFFNLAGIIGLLNSITFCASTFFPDEKGNYNPLWGLLMVIPSSFLSIFFIPVFTERNIKMNFTHMIIFYCLCVLTNIYFVLDLWQITRVRFRSFLIGDYTLVFFSVWFDWTFKFWRYLFTKPEDLVEEKKKSFGDDFGEGGDFGVDNNDDDDFDDDTVNS